MSGPRSRDSLEIVLDPVLDERAAARPEPRRELPALCRFAGYDLLGRIAVGGMAEVFLGRELQGGAARLVALKVIRAQLESDPSFAEMFMREGTVALGLRHPNVCHVYRFGMERGHPFLAMELVEGISVRDLIRRARRAGRTIPPPIAAKVASSVAEGLHSAHVACDERGNPLEIVHQDVSPHNVMVAWDGTVKLLDFGVAQSSLENDVTSSESSHTTIRGKLAYLSPEQCTGARVDARSDVFTLGVVLHEMVTGERLFKRDQTLSTMRAIASEALPAEALAKVPEPLARVITKAVAKRPADRYPDAAAMQEDLERYLADERIVVTSAKIAAAVAELVGEDRVRVQELDVSPGVVAWLDDGRALRESLAPAAASSGAPAAPRRAWIGWAVAVVLAVGGVVGALVTSGTGDEPSPVAAAEPPAPSSRISPAEASAEGLAADEAAADDAQERADVDAPAPQDADPVAASAQLEPRAAQAEPAAGPSSARDGSAAGETRRARRRGAVPAPGGFLDDPGF